jgi:hypothetical protein
LTLPGDGTFAGAAVGPFPPLLLLLKYARCDEDDDDDGADDGCCDLSSLTLCTLACLLFLSPPGALSGANDKA